MSKESTQLKITTFKNLIAPDSANPLDLGTILDEVLQLGSKPYKVYSGLLFQNGLNDPTVTVFENTIGNIVWTRSSIGNYLGTFEGAFTAGKVHFTFGNVAYSIINAGWNDVNSVWLQVDKIFTDLSNNPYNPARLHDKCDGLLYETPFEIRVYE